jgi:hypothetical protein
MGATEESGGQADSGDSDGPEASASLSFDVFGPYKLSGGGAIALADFNEDRKLDIALSGLYANYRFLVLLGKGDGTFGTPNVYDTAVVSESIAVADVDGDSHLDVVLPDFSGGGVQVWRGDGSGAFVGPVVSSGEYGAWGVAVGDFNDDGRLDVVKTNASRANVALLLGNGDATFQAETRIDQSGSSDAVATGHFDADAFLDVAVRQEETGAVKILLGNGEGTFRAGGTYSLGAASTVDWTGLAIADFNRDGRPDLASNTHEDNDVHALLGNGDGTFQVSNPYPVGTSPKCTVAADFDSDGRVDLAVGTDQGVSVLFGNGDGTFQPALLVGAPSFQYLASGDLDGDGLADLVGTDGLGALTVLLARNH